MSADTRLIERWLPIAALGEESIRERRSMTSLPPTYYLHVWWARRPLIASRAAILASVLPGSASHQHFLHCIGIHGDPVASRRRIDVAKRKGIRFEGEAYEYPRAFTYRMDPDDSKWFNANAKTNAIVLDPTAGGGSIPFESVRAGLSTVANDLNPVSAVVLRATVDYPARFGLELLPEFRRLAEMFVAKREEAISDLYPTEPLPDCVPTNYLWTRTISCPYCDGLVPLSPNWRLNSDGVGVRVTPHHTSGNRRCTFEVVNSAKEHSEGTVTGGDAVCPFSDCGRVIKGEEIKVQAQAGQMGQQLYAVVYRHRVVVRTKSGKPKEKWVREFRSPRVEDDNVNLLAERMLEKNEEWQALDLVPDELFPDTANDDRPIRYGMPRWRDFFAQRQLLVHGISVQIYRELLEDERSNERLSDIRKAAFVYLALAIDSYLNYGNMSCRWDSMTERVRSIFDRHDFAFCASYCEMALVLGALPN